MTKNLLLWCFLFSLIFMSCSKNIERNQGTQSTTALTLKSDETGVTLEDATSFAVNFLKYRNNNTTTVNDLSKFTPSVSVTSASTLTNNGKPYFHVINTSAGWVILSADSLYAPLLAWDSAGSFSYDASALNPGLKNWFNKHASQLDFVRNTKNVITDSLGASNKKLWIAEGSTFAPPIVSNNHIAGGQNNRTEVNYDPPTIISVVDVGYTTTVTKGPFCITSWDQIYPWNEDCPAEPLNRSTLYEGYAPVGCVEVAMAQLMWYWKWPNNNPAYNWSGMVLKDDLNNSATWPVNNPAGYAGEARLMSDIGQFPGTFWTDALHSLNSNTFAYYQSGQTTSDPEYCATIFNSFGYTSAQTSLSTADQVLQGGRNGVYYESLLTSELQANRPCLVSGYPSEHSVLGILYPSGSGHTWVCDGSQEMTFYEGTQTTERNGNGTITVVTIYPDVSTVHFLDMNWGYGGSDNGWFDGYTDYTVYTNSSSAQTNYQYFQNITYNIHP